MVSLTQRCRSSPYNSAPGARAPGSKERGPWALGSMFPGHGCPGPVEEAASSLPAGLWLGLSPVPVSEDNGPLLCTVLGDWPSTVTLIIALDSLPDSSLHQGGRRLSPFPIQRTCAPCSPQQLLSRAHVPSRCCSSKITLQPGGGG